MGIAWQGMKYPIIDARATWYSIERDEYRCLGSKGTRAARSFHPPEGADAAAENETTPPTVAGTPAVHDATTPAYSGVVRAEVGTGDHGLLVHTRAAALSADTSTGTLPTKRLRRTFAWPDLHAAHCAPRTPVAAMGVHQPRFQSVRAAGLVRSGDGRRPARAGSKKAAGAGVFTLPFLSLD
ncbi:hypothetical protein C8F04DRAFT_1117294 [Mycena alexandri]|uniref:Uncharacterized protein n=1 Tax=Mycena alexandri TaxID=1745969 RepID=A0AAD6SJH2_9AGAR|nr:hypothetical protein C8F04DRAFT_1117294 [Mycena alexandri]